MANLADLAPSEIGIIAFWNAHDHRVTPGVGDVDPTDCIAIFDSYDVYDNGIEGYKALGSGRYFHARVKTDGWMVAWIDRTNTFAYPNKPPSNFGESGFKGYYDILWDWTVVANISSTETTLSYIIDQLFNQLSNKIDFTFDAADVGHYCYEHPSTNVMTLLSNSSSGSETTGDVQYTAGTTIYYAAMTGRGYWTCNITPHVKFDGNTLIGGICGQYLHASVDIIADNWMPNPTTNYTLATYYGGHGSILILWS